MLITSSEMSSNSPASGSLKPPLLKNASSSSSLSGLEQAAPSFQKFLRRTPSPASSNEDKPLPPVPLAPRRSTRTANEFSWPPSNGVRRTSSVYSRTPSLWVDDSVSHQCIDLSEYPLPTLQPLAYSASTPQLPSKLPAGGIHRPRAFDPLITEPPPLVSQGTSPSPPPSPPRSGSRPSILLPLHSPSAKIPKKHRRTVSLEKAKRAIHAPGANHLLPEELRAKRTRLPGSETNDLFKDRSRSHEHIRLSSVDIFNAYRAPSASSRPPTLIDSQGRDRLLENAAIKPIARSSTGIFRAGMPDERSFPQTRSPKSQRPPASSRHSHRGVDSKNPYTAGYESTGERRGRTKRRSGDQSDDRFVPSSQPRSNAKGIGLGAQELAAQYHTLLDDSFMQHAHEHETYGTESDGSTDVKTHMKMIPQPLFQKPRPMARVSREVNGKRDSAQSASAYKGHRDTRAVSPPTGRYSDSFPLRLSVSPKARHHRRQSTSGTIPISPPSFIAARSAPGQSPYHPSSRKSKPRKARKRTAGKSSVSAFYPHVMHRKEKSKVEITAPVDETSVSPKTTPVPPSASDTTLERPRTPNAFLRAFAPVDSTQNQKASSKGGTSSHTKDLHERLIDKTARYAENLRHQRSRSRETTPQPDSSLESSPHLQPTSSPVETKAPQSVVLGWSDRAKHTFDRVHSPIHSPKSKRKPSVEHSITPARPLGERSTALAEPDSPTRRPSLFGNMLDGWREGKANKRREDLKKMIKVVPTREERGDDEGDATGGGGGNRSSTGGMARRPSILQGFSSQSWSSGGWRIGGG